MFSIKVKWNKWIVGGLLGVLNSYVYVLCNVGKFSRLVDGWEVSEILADICIMLFHSSNEVGGLCACMHAFSCR